MVQKKASLTQIDQISPPPKQDVVHEKVFPKYKQTKEVPTNENVVKSLAKTPFFKKERERTHYIHGLGNKCLQSEI